MPSSSDRVTEECRKGHEHFDTFPRKRDVLPILMEALNLKEDSEHFLNSITQKQISRICLQFRQAWINGHRIPCSWVLGVSDKCVGTTEDLRSQLKRLNERLVRNKKDNYEDLTRLTELQECYEETLKKAKEAEEKLKAKEKVYNQLMTNYDQQKKLLKEVEGQLEKTSERLTQKEKDLKEREEQLQEAEAKLRVSNDSQKKVLEKKKVLEQQSQEAEATVKYKEEKLQKAKSVEVQLRNQLQKWEADYDQLNKRHEEQKKDLQETQGMLENTNINLTHREKDLAERLKELQKLQKDDKEKEGRTRNFEMYAEELLSNIKGFTAEFYPQKDLKRKRTEDCTEKDFEIKEQGLLDETIFDEVDQQVVEEMT